PTLSTADLARTFLTDVKQALQIVLEPHNPVQLMAEVRTRQLIEDDLVRYLQPTLNACGLVVNGVRLVEFLGPAIQFLRDKLREIERLSRENGLNRALGDALREEKVIAFRDKQQLEDCYEQITQEFGFKSAEREEEKKRFIQAAQHKEQLAAVRNEYEVRRA